MREYSREYNYRVLRDNELKKYKTVAEMDAQGCYHPELVREVYNGLEKAYKMDDIAELLDGMAEKDILHFSLGLAEGNFSFTEELLYNLAYDAEDGRCFMKEAADKGIYASFLFEESREKYHAVVDVIGEYVMFLVAWKIHEELMPAAAGMAGKEA